MENEKKFFEFVGTASEHAGTLAGKVASIGGKIANLASDRVSSGKEMLGLADKKVKDVSEKKPDNSNASTLKSDLAAALRKLTKAEKTQSKLESQLKELKTENQSLVSELDQVRSELSEVRSCEGVVRARAAALESELDAAQQRLEQMQNKTDNTKLGKRTATGSKAKLESDLAATLRELDKMRDETKKTKSQFKLKLTDMRAEKESLLSELTTVRKDTREIAAREYSLTEQVAALESELAATQRELANTQRRAEKTQSELTTQLKDLQVEKESLISDLEKARQKAGDAGVRADSMDAQIPSPESDVAAFDLGVGTTCEEESDVDVTPRQTEPESSNENRAVIAVVPVEAKSESSVEVDAAQEDPIEADVENVEGSEPIFESEAEIEAEEIKPGPIPDVEVTESLEVTAEEVQAAVFKNGADKILFTKAVSDFTSQEAASRADAVGVIAGIRHELSPRLLITRMVDEPTALVRRECVKALATLEMKEGISAIERALADEAASVRLAAVWGLYRLAGIESIPALIPMLSDRDASVRRRAITCIGWVGGQIAKTGNNHCQQVISALIRCLNDHSESIKNATLDTLQAVTGKKMPASRTSPERLAEQWRKWWKAELLG